jgi:diaminopimelate epimerase
MHGLGNDFMVLDLVTQEATLDPGLVQSWSDRRTGIGFDQLLVVEPPSDPQSDFWYRIYNADGSEAEQCGNGARCIATFIRHVELSPKTELSLQTAGGMITTRRLEASVQVDMGVPSTAPQSIPFTADVEAQHYTLESATGCHEVTPVSIGNPHGVLFVDDIAEVDVETIGAALTDHPRFPEGANIGFCQVVDKKFVRLRVYERGVGETRACGTGACAAVVACQLDNRVEQTVKVSLPGGKLRVNWQGPGSAVKMTGPATLVYEGSLEL